LTPAASSSKSSKIPTPPTASTTGAASASTAGPAGHDPATLADCPHFHIRRVPLKPGAELTFPAHEQPRILSVAEGSLATDDPAHPQLERGANILIPFASSLVLRALDPATLLVTDNFSL
jgi:hypothetical protein